MNSSEARELRTAWIQTIERQAPNYFLTFCFGYQIRSLNADRYMRKFFNALQRKAHGHDWASQFDRGWPIAFGFFEHPDTNPHYHVLARVDPEIGDVLELYGAEIWKKIAPRGQLHVEEVNSPHKVRSYATKRLASRQRFDDVFVYSDTRVKPSPESDL